MVGGWGAILALATGLWWLSRIEIKGFNSNVIPHTYTMMLSLLGEVGVAHGADWEEQRRTPREWVGESSPGFPGEGEYSFINKGPYPKEF